MAFARGKHAYFLSDRSGMRFPYRERIKEWNGSVVHISEYEEKHEQLDPHRTVIDSQSLRESRPDVKTESTVETLLGLNPFLSSSSGSGVITVVEKSHGRSSGDTVRFRNIVGFDGFTTAVLEKADGYSITKVDDNTYTFSASSGTSLVGSINGGGRNATAGPVTLGA